MPCKCIKCSHFNLRDSSDMAKLGYGGCLKAKAGEYRSAFFEIECNRLSPASSDDVTKRIEWLERKRK